MSRSVKPVGVAAVCLMLLCPITTMAQSSQNPDLGDDRIDATGVGIAGGIIAGGELVVVTEALIGVDKLWAYLTFPFAGAAAGGVGGYYLEQASPEGAVALLVGSLVLLIPTAILASRAMAYDPEKVGELDSDARGVRAFSFEGTPAGEPPDGTTHTEVESRPEETPVEGPAMPPEEGDPSGGKIPPPDGVSPANELEEDSLQGKDQASSRRITKRRQAKRAMVRRAAAGSLLYVNDKGNTGFTVPFVDIRPARYVYNVPGAKPGVEIYLPLLRIDY
ncbi:MAG: hypothetical protein GY762_20645 [Proteobacteria bacterium]|nr:hypothetical protein [Pseudomonadota bacterium]